MVDLLHSDIVRIILGFAEPHDVRNFSLTSKRYLRFLTDLPIWLNFCVTRTRFTREVFMELVEGKKEVLFWQCYGQRYPYNPYYRYFSLVEGGNRCFDVYLCMIRVHRCNHQFKRGKLKGQYCGEPTIPGAPMCRDCISKKTDPMWRVALQ